MVAMLQLGDTPFQICGHAYTPVRAAFETAAEISPSAQPAGADDNPINSCHSGLCNEYARQIQGLPELEGLYNKIGGEEGIRVSTFSKNLDYKGL